MGTNYDRGKERCSENSRVHVGRQSVGRTATLEHLDDGVAEVGRAERVEERVDGRVDVRQPERGGVEVVGDEVRAEDADVVDEVERHPADDVADDNVRQRHEALAFAVRSRLRV